MRRGVGGKAWVRRLLGGGRRRRIVVLVSACVLLATLAAIFVTRQVGIGALRRDIARLTTERAAATERQKALRVEVASTTNPQVLEQEIRERLGLVKPLEEKVFFIEEAAP